MNNELKLSITDVHSSDHANCTSGPDYSTAGCISHNILIRAYIV
jgi:hypothetical protein